MVTRRAGTGARINAALSSTINDLFAASLAPSTRRQYARDMRQFRQVCLLVKARSWFPATLPLVASFVAHMFTRGYSASSIQAALSAVSFYHKMLGEADPTGDFLIKKLVLGTKRHKPTADSRVPVTRDILKQLVNAAPAVSHDDYTARLLTAMFTLAYHALLRVSEMVDGSSSHSIQFRDVAVTMQELVITFRSYKHSVPGKCFTLAVPSIADKDICPVSLVKRFLVVRGVLNGPLFVLPGGVIPSQAWFSSLLSACAAAAGLSHLRVTSHSFRIGRVCDMAAERYSAEEIRLLGRWRSDAFRAYMRVSAARC